MNINVNLTMPADWTAGEAEKFVEAVIPEFDRMVAERSAHEHLWQPAGCDIEGGYGNAASLPADGKYVTAPQAAFAEAWEAARAETCDGYVQLTGSFRNYDDSYTASGWRVRGELPIDGYGPTPTAALVALREKLDSANSESSCREAMG